MIALQVQNALRMIRRAISVYTWSWSQRHIGPTSDNHLGSYTQLPNSDTLNNAADG